MKTLLLRFSLVTTLLLPSNMLPCSGITKSFCETRAERKTDVVILGFLSGMGTNSVQINVIDVFSGSESRTIVTVWAGKDFDCNGNVSMQVTELGNTGDTIIISMGLITSSNITNPWEVAGDYKRPNDFYRVAWLPVINNVVTGFINSIAPPQKPYGYVTNIRYPDFKAYYNSHQQDCTTIVSLEEKSIKDSYDINFNGGFLSVKSTQGKFFFINVTSIEGKTIKTHGFSTEHQIPLTELADGVFLVSIIGVDGSIMSRKYLK